MARTEGWLANPDDAKIVEAVPMLWQLARCKGVRIDDLLFADNTSKQT